MGEGRGPARGGSLLLDRVLLQAQVLHVFRPHRDLAHVGEGALPYRDILSLGRGNAHGRIAHCSPRHIDALGAGDGDGRSLHPADGRGREVEAVTALEVDAILGVRAARDLHVGEDVGIAPRGRAVVEG